MTRWPQPSSDPNSPFYDDPLYGHPWMTAAEAEEKRRKRHKLWLSRITPADWRRIEALGDQASSGFCPARLDDLEAPGLAVGVKWAADKGGCSGERIGTLRDGLVEVVVWTK